MSILNSSKRFLVFIIFMFIKEMSALSRSKKTIKRFIEEDELEGVCDFIEENLHHVLDVFNSERQRKQFSTSHKDFIEFLKLIKTFYFQLNSDCQKNITSSLLKIHQHLKEFLKTKTSQQLVDKIFKQEGVLAGIITTCIDRSKKQSSQDTRTDDEKVSELLKILLLKIQMIVQEELDMRNISKTKTPIMRLRMFLLNNDPYDLSLLKRGILFSVMKIFGADIRNVFTNIQINNDIKDYILSLLGVWKSNFKESVKDTEYQQVAANCALVILKRIVLACSLFLDKKTANSMFMLYMEKLKPTVPELDEMMKNAYRIPQRRRKSADFINKIRSRWQEEKKKKTDEGTHPSEQQTQQWKKFKKWQQEKINSTPSSVQPSQQQIQQWEQFKKWQQEQKKETTGGTPSSEQQFKKWQKFKQIKKIKTWQMSVANLIQQLEQEKNKIKKQEPQSAQRKTISSQGQSRSVEQEKKQTSSVRTIQQPQRFQFQYESPGFHHRQTVHDDQLRQRKNKNIPDVQRDIATKNLPRKIMEIAIMGNYSSIILVDVANKRHQFSSQQQMRHNLRRLIPADVPTKSRRKPLFVLVEQADLDQSSTPMVSFDDGRLRSGVLRILVSCVKQTHDGRRIDCYKKESGQQFTKNPMDDFVILTLQYALRSYYYKHMRHMGNDIRLLKKLETFRELISDNPYNVLLQQEQLGNIVSESYENIRFDEKVPYTWLVSDDLWKDWARRR